MIKWYIPFGLSSMFGFLTRDLMIIPLLITAFYLIDFIMWWGAVDRMSQRFVQEYVHKR